MIDFDLVRSLFDQGAERDFRGGIRRVETDALPLVAVSEKDRVNDVFYHSLHLIRHRESVPDAIRAGDQQERQR